MPRSRAAPDLRWGTFGKPSQCQGQYLHATTDCLWRAVLIRPMADAIFAGNEDHAHRIEAGHEQGVVVCTTDHALARQTELAAGVCDRHDHGLVRAGRRIGVEQLHLKSHTPAACRWLRRLANAFHDAIARAEIDVADINLQHHLAGNAVDRARVDAANAGSAAGAAMAVTTPMGTCSRSSSGPCSMCSSTKAA